MSEAYIGEIRIFAGNYAPVNWAICDGSLLSINQYEALYTLVGTTYGGDGTTTFGIPDLRGRVPIHMGQGPGLSVRNLAEQGGVEIVTLTQAAMPAHTHAVMAVNAAGTLKSPNGGYFANTSGCKAYSTAVPNAVMAAQLTSAGGVSQAHGNMMPYMVTNYIIALIGMYPDLT